PARRRGVEPTLAERKSARLDANRRPARSAGQLLRPRAAGMVRDRRRPEQPPAARAEHDGGGPLHAPPLHELQPAHADRGAPLDAGEGTRTLTPPEETPDFYSSAYQEARLRYRHSVVDGPEAGRGVASAVRSHT